MKILCICDWGTVRSVALAQHIKEQNCERYNKPKRLKYEVLAVGEWQLSKGTMDMLKEWADHIIDVREYIPDIYKYTHSKDPELTKKVREIWRNFIKCR